jgi:hypothetical protein
MNIRAARLRDPQADLMTSLDGRRQRSPRNPAAGAISKDHDINLAVQAHRRHARRVIRCPHRQPGTGMLAVRCRLAKRVEIDFNHASSDLFAGRRDAPFADGDLPTAMCRLRPTVMCRLRADCDVPCENFLYGFKGARSAPGPRPGQGSPLTRRRAERPKRLGHANAGRQLVGACSWDASSRRAPPAALRPSGPRRRRRGPGP